MNADFFIIDGYIEQGLIRGVSDMGKIKYQEMIKNESLDKWETDEECKDDKPEEE